MNGQSNARRSRKSSINERGRAAKRRSSMERAPLFRVRGFFVCDYCLLKWECSETFFRPDASFCRACPECYEPTEPRRTAALRLCRSCDCFPCQCHQRKAVSAKNKTAKPAKAKSNATQKVLKKKSVPAKSKPKGKKQTKPVSKATKPAQKTKGAKPAKPKSSKSANPTKAKSKAVSKGKKQTKPKPSSQAQGCGQALPSKAKPASKPAKQTKGAKPAKAKSNVSQKAAKGKKQNKPNSARSASQAQGRGRAVPPKSSNATKAKAQRKKQQNKAKARGLKRSRPQNGKVYGYYRCSECHRGWESAYTYVENGKAQYGPQCKSCRSKKHHKAYDWKATQKTCPKCKALSDLKDKSCRRCGHRFGDDDVHIDPNKKHIQALCARCRDLPQPCSARY